jgi:hypothetical protein
MEIVGAFDPGKLQNDHEMPERYIEELWRSLKSMPKTASSGQKLIEEIGIETADIASREHFVLKSR